MKRFISIILFGMLLFTPFYANAADESQKAAEPSDISQTTEATAAENISLPKLMVTDYKLSDTTISSKKNTKLSVTVQNMSKTSAAEAVKLTFSCPDGAVLPSGTDSVYIEKLAPNEKYIWTLNVTASSLAESGAHSASVAAVYDSGGGETVSSSDNITLKVSVPEKTPPTENNSQPRLMVTEYTVENDGVTPGSFTGLTIKLKNMSTDRTVRNVKLSLSDDSGEIRFDGMGSVYVGKISPNSEYEWKTSVTAVNTAAVGEHNINFLAEYEDSSSSPYSATDVIRISVRQKASLDFSGASLPSKVVQGDTVTVSVNLMNTGKSSLYNCKVSFDIDNISSGGGSFAGELAAGESKSVGANLKISPDFEGKVNGVITVSCEDAFGNVLTKTEKVSTVIEKKVEKSEKDKENEKKYPLWWLFLLVGVLAGAGAGVGTVLAVISSKNRKEDEKRL